MKNANFPKLLLLSLSLLAACGTTPQTDASFGTSTMAIKAQQMRDPAASVRNENRPVDGIDGKSASHAVDRYQQSFSVPAPPMTILNLGVGGTVK